MSIRLGHWQSTMTAVLRPYRSGDQAALLEAWDASARHAYPFCDDEFFKKNAEAIVTRFIPKAETTVCLVDDRLVGFVSMLGSTVGGLFVHPDHIGQGFGRLMMDHVAGSFDELHLGVFTKNRIGRAFYERYGFRERGPREIDPESGHELMNLTWTRPPGGSHSQGKRESRPAPDTPS